MRVEPFEEGCNAAWCSILVKCWICNCCVKLLEGLSWVLILVVA